MKRRFLWQLFPSYLVIMLLALVAFAVNISFLIDAFYTRQIRETLEVRAMLAREIMETAIAAANFEQIDALCKQIGRETRTRITVIDTAGKVLGESDTQPQTMGSHLMRPEVQEAIQNKVAFHVRPSTTLKQQMMYVAVPLLRDNQVIAVVRTAVPLVEIQQTLSALTHSVIRYGIITSLVLAFVSLWHSWRFSRPLVLLQRAAREFAEGRLSQKINISGSREITSLAKAMNSMAMELDQRIRSATRQHNEQQAVFTAMIEGVIAFDLSGRCLTLNIAAAKMLELDAAKAVGRTVGELVRNSDLQVFIQHALQSIQSTEDFILMPQPGRQELYLQVRTSALMDSSDKYIGSLVVLNDMTRIHRLEQVRRDFVANVSHELKTPVTSIQGFIETLQDGAINDIEDAKRFVGIIARQTSRLNSIIEDLLLLCQLEQQNETVHVPKDICQVRRILEEAVELCRHKAEQRKISIEIDSAFNITATVNASLLEQAVLNLTDNAIKYSPDGSRIIIRTEIKDKQWFIHVQDFGSGIAPEHLERIFERFYRIDKARSRQMGGTGLGLSIVKHIAQYHKGSVHVQSEHGKGSIFTLSFPLDSDAFPGRENDTPGRER